MLQEYRLPIVVLSILFAGALRYQLPEDLRHAAIGYVTRLAKLEGREPQIFAERCGDYIVYAGERGRWGHRVARVADAFDTNPARVPNLNRWTIGW
jgi:hypothetical protein